MEDFVMPDISGTTTTISAIATAVISGLAYLAKYILDNRDKKQKEVFEARDKDKAEMKEDIRNLKSDVKDLNTQVHKVTAIVLSCDNPDCPTKKKLAEYWKEKDKG